VNHIASALVRERIAQLHREARINRVVIDEKSAARLRPRHSAPID
jgi:hypothetical protein